MSDLCQQDVADLAAVASELDFMKNRCASGAWKNLLTQAVEVMHRVGEKLDRQHAFHIYAQENDDE